MGVDAQVTVDLDDVFSDLDKYYPGSKRQRRAATEESPVGRRTDAWDARPIIKMHRGEETEFFMLGSFAQALGKSTVTMRLWERKAYIPKSPYRLPSNAAPDGRVIPGKRVFTRDLIEAAIEEFARRDLLGTARVEWKYHRDLTIALFERWTAITTAN